MTLQINFLKKIKELQKSIEARKQYLKSNTKDTDNLILFFVPSETDHISGGLLSICSILQEVNTLFEVHKSNVVASFLPKKRKTAHTFSQFKNDIVVFNFSQITTEFKKPKKLEIHIPDYMVPLFSLTNKKMAPLLQWIQNIEHVQINILNQNDLLMPSQNYIDALKKISKNLTMTVAHDNYATQEKRDHYGIPLHLLQPWMSPTPYLFKAYEDKENIIIVSPDEIDRVPNKTSVTKQEILDQIAQKLPHYKIVVISDMKYDTYKELIAKAKFAITFGEGLDNYFVESIFSGCISFAVYNAVFFTTEFQNSQTVYANFDTLHHNIVTDILVLDKKEAFEVYQKKQLKLVSDIYSYKRFKRKIKEYYQGDLDFK
ncbi:hypothetical protein [Flavobacterium crassostreae]|uniref:Glycosyltransferase n=1 Tax=Flavobacterium crassostreae TaxID=1763534 RepID=A0A1B9E9T4_9FLAO|nr:hypothetical protein [Flavobacterium crassostreae]OCB78714.1 hypothetical protein LPBF_01595 [Flavobacterium crassostreae]